MSFVAIYFFHLKKQIRNNHFRAYSTDSDHNSTQQIVIDMLTSTMLFLKKVFCSLLILSLVKPVEVTEEIFESKVVQMTSAYLNL